MLFGVGSLGTGIYLTVPSVLLLYYLTDVLHVAPALAGLAVFLPRAYDIVLDPIVGWISDRTRSPMGRRRPYMLAGSAVTAVTFVLLFNAPATAADTATFWYIVAVYALSATGYSIFAVPYLAMPAEMSADPDVRTEVMAYRIGFAMAGILLGSALAPWLVAVFGGGRPGFSMMGWIVGPLAAAAMLVAFFGTRHAPVVAAGDASSGITAALADVARNRAFRRLGLAYAVQLTGLGCFNAAIPYFVVHVMGRGDADIAALFAFVLAGSIASMAPWSWLARRVGKVPAYALAVAIIVVSMGGLWFAADAASWAASVVSVAVMGIGFGGAQLLPFSVLSDVIHETASGAAGAYTGAWTAIEKAGLAVGPLIVGAALQLTGFVEGLAGSQQSAGALAGVLGVVAIVPAVLVGASLPLLRGRPEVAR